jgi:hypothetical protein
VRVAGFPGRASLRWTSIAARLAIVASHGPSSFDGSKLAAARHAWRNACWVASSASPRSPSTLYATANTSRPYARYTVRTASSSPAANRESSGSATIAA